VKESTRFILAFWLMLAAAIVMRSISPESIGLSVKYGSMLIIATLLRNPCPICKSAGQAYDRFQNWHGDRI